MSTRHWRGWLAAGAIFVFGFALGAAGTAWVGVRLVRRALQAPVGAFGPADRAAARIGADLTKTLELSAEQSARLQSILDESAAKMKAIRAQATTQARQELEASTARIAAGLPAEKRAAFYRIVARRYERLGLPPPSPEPKS